MVDLKNVFSLKHKKWDIWQILGNIFKKNIYIKNH